MIKNLELAELRALAAQIECQSCNHNISPEVFLLTLQCFSRLPFASKRIKEFLVMIKTLLDAGQDYTLLLKAGILTGLFPDYTQYKKDKVQRFVRNRKIAEENSLLEVIAKRSGEENYDIRDGVLTFFADIAWLNQLRSSFPGTMRDKENGRRQYDFFWKRLTEDQQNMAEVLNPASLKFGDLDDFDIRWESALNTVVSNKIERLRTKLQLSDDQWTIIARNNSTTGVSFISVSRKEFSTGGSVKITKSKYGEIESVGEVLPDSAEYIVEGRHFISEEMLFVSIFQDALWKPSPFGIGRQLEKYYITTHNGEKPTGKEMNALRQRYYRYIRRSYPAEVEKCVPHSDRNGKSYLLALSQDKTKYHFFLYSGKKHKNGHIGELQFDHKKKLFWLLPGSVLDRNISEIGDCGIDDFIQKNEKSGAIVLRQDGNYQVLKKVEVHSPSQAAWLVCGYKRNGLIFGRNAQGKALGELLDRKEKIAPVNP